MFTFLDKKKATQSVAYLFRCIYISEGQIYFTLLSMCYFKVLERKAGAGAGRTEHHVRYLFASMAYLPRPFLHIGIGAVSPPPVRFRRQPFSLF